MPRSDFGVWKDNWETLLVFLSLQTQWRDTPLGMGLDYAGVAAALRETEPRRKKRRELFEAIQAMEFAAAEVLNKR